MLGVGVVGDLFGHCPGDPLALQVMQQALTAYRFAAEELRCARGAPCPIVNVAVLAAPDDSRIGVLLIVATLEKSLTQLALGEVTTSQQCQCVGERPSRRSARHIEPAGPSPTVPVATFLACIEFTIPRSCSLRSFGLVAAAIATSSVMNWFSTRASSD